MRLVLLSLLLLVTAADLFSASFSRDIAPILVTECLACHSDEKAKGGYRVHTFAAVLSPGKSEQPPIVAGKPEESELFKRIITHDELDRMPQDDEPLASAQIELFRVWIARGATLDRGDSETALASLIPKAVHPAPPEYYRRAVPILALAFDPSGERLAVGGYHEISLWTPEGELLSRITNAPQRIHAIAFQPAAENRFAIAGGKPGRAGELSVYQDGNLLTNLLQTADELLTVAFSADGKLLAGGGSDNTIHVFRTETWERVTTIQQHADWVTSVCFDSDGENILSASRDRTARIYNADSGELEITYPGHGAALSTAIFLSDNKAASAGKENEIHIWDVKEGKKQNEIGGIEGEIFATIAAGEYFFTASADKKVRQYETKSRNLFRTFSGHHDAVYSIAFHADTGRLAAGAYDGTVKIWSVQDGKLQSSFVAAPLKGTEQASLRSAAAE